MERGVNLSFPAPERYMVCIKYFPFLTCYSLFSLIARKKYLAISY